MKIKVAKFNFTLTVFIRLNAAAFIKFFSVSNATFIQGRCLFKRGVYYEITFFTITDNSYCKSFVNIM